MQTIIIILALVSIIDVWIHNVVFPICYNKLKFNKVEKFFKFILDRKPFNCDICLSFWIGLILSILYLNIGYLLLPLLTKLKNRVI